MMCSKRLHPVLTPLQLVLVALVAAACMFPRTVCSQPAPVGTPDDIVFSETVIPLKSEPCRLWAAAFAPDGKTLATAGGDESGDEVTPNNNLRRGELGVWDLA